MRCFVAISPSENVRKKLAAFASECADVFPGMVKPSAPPNLHLTLSFLGETDPSRFEVIFDALAAIRFPVFRLAARGGEP